jgi:hypothetical protein
VACPLASLLADVLVSAQTEGGNAGADVLAADDAADGWGDDGQYDTEAVLHGGGGGSGTASGIVDHSGDLVGAPLAMMVGTAVRSMLGRTATPRRRAAGASAHPTASVREGGLVDVAAGLLDGVAAAAGASGRAAPLPSEEERALLHNLLFAPVAQGAPPADAAPSRAAMRVCASATCRMCPPSAPLTQGTGVCRWRRLGAWCGTWPSTSRASSSARPTT